MGYNLFHAKKKKNSFKTVNIKYMLSTVKDKMYVIVYLNFKLRLILVFIFKNNSLNSCIFYNE